MSDTAAANPATILKIEDLKTYFPIKKGSFFPKVVDNVMAVNGVSLDIKKGEVLGLVGESGCGKSTLGKSLIKLVDITAGKIIFEGKDVAFMNEDEFRPMRLNLQMIFQDPYASLDPRMTVFDTLSEPLLAHNIVSKDQIVAKVTELMKTVGLAPRFLKKYPHEFSGGQRQRIAIARALALNPDIIIADEPVSALDVSIQSQILNLLMDLKEEFNLTLIFISHDLSVIEHISDRVAVMYLGKIIELAPTKELFSNPMHPYTQALLSAIPKPDPRYEKKRESERVLLKGDPPSPINPPPGCGFAPRCPKKKSDKCDTHVPSLTDRGNDHFVADCPCTL